LEPTQPEQIVSVVRAAIEELESPHLRLALLSGLITPVREQRAFWSRSGDAHGDLWVFFIIPRRKNVGIAYSEEGYGLLGDRWGLVFVDSVHYGDRDVWYPSLADLLAENGSYLKEQE
jgi:hypothetical protein